MVFGVNEKVRLQCPKTKLWNIRGKVHGLRFSEAGSIVLYDIILENGNVTSRHRRFMTKDLPEVESQAVIHDEETGIHGAFMGNQVSLHQDIPNMRIQISLIQEILNLGTVP